MNDNRLVRFYRATTTHNNQKCSVCDETILANAAFIHVGHPLSIDICIDCATEMHSLLVSEQDYEQRARRQDWVQMSLF